MSRMIEAKGPEEELSLKGVAFAGAISSIPGTVRRFQVHMKLYH